MDCPHLISAVQLSVEWLAQKCAEVLASSSAAGAATDSTTASAPASPSAARNQWKCLECQSDAENWLCLHCGAVLCGRYVNKHALQHSHRPDNAGHSVCLNTLSRAVYCYSCDEFVINDTPCGRLNALRNVFPADLDDEEEDGEHQHACDDEECEARSECKRSAAEDTVVHSSTSTAAVAPQKGTLQTQQRPQEPQQHPQQQHPTHHSPKKGRRTTSDTVATVAATATVTKTSSAAAKALHETRSTSSSDSGLGVEEFPATPHAITATAVSSSLLSSSAAAGPTQSLSPSTAVAASNGGRKLRPRKRTASAESASDASNTSGCSASRSTTTAATTSTAGGSRATTATTPAKRKLLRKVVGLRNLGNTCFMNSVLQSLSNIQEFSCYFNALPSLDPNAAGNGAGGAKPKRVYHSRSLKENHSAADANVVEELRKILTNLSHGGDGSKAISPECLFLVIWKVVPQFRGHRQHDAHEFLRYMLDRLHTELQHVAVPPTASTTTTTGAAADDADATAAASSGGKLQLGPATSGLEAGSIMFKGRSSIVTSVFGGTLQSEVRCLVCGMESKKHDPFLDLSLDIPEKFYKETPASEDGQTKPPSCHIADCLSSFTEIEELAETELYYCSACKCKQKSTKRFWIRRLPNVLCLHIKRFRWNNFFRTKIDLRITFPITSMDMSQFVLNNGPETRRSTAATNVYDLAAVIVHHGNGSSCGHYTSYAINNGTWLHFNDHTVKEVHPSAVEECKPYILFYIRRDPNASKS